ncbi:hypothetical protein [Caulobacter sp. NIBR2454]|uniref:hypothetical protein n=1 Tax=Caulobacter sp. NIBR2454 TaxID=3015996 RepID=UPI0022B65C42|nr:hypothetical protein [Caulobacter sp. NIBR2454]
MDLLERYLGAVAALLPRAQRDDIVAELRDLLLNRFEEREAELGRTLTRQEQEAIIQANGHPLIVAGRYGGQGPLIGPAVYPLYMQAVKVSLAIGALVTAILTVIALFNRPERLGQVIIQGINDYVGLVITVVGLLTIVGWLVERGVVKLNFLDNWRPSRLPAVTPDLPPLPGLPFLNSLGAIGSTTAGAPKQRGKSRFESVFELVVTLWVLAWWLGWTPVSFGELGDELRVIPAPIWTALHWPIAGLLAVQIAASLSDLLLTAAVRVRASLALASHLILLGLVWVLWNARPLFQLEAASHPELMTTVQLSVEIGLMVTAAIAVGYAGREIWRLARG